MAVAAYDYNNFLEKYGQPYIFFRSKLIPFNTLLANEIPGLNGLPIAEFLLVMDRLEFNVLSQENEEIRSIAEKDVTWIRGMGITGLSSFMVGLFGPFSLPIASAVALALMPIFAALVCLSAPFTFFYGMNMEKKNQLMEAKISEIYDNRLLRLQHKTRSLNGRIILIEDHNEKEQLQIAHDFFSLKYQLYLAQKITNANYV